MKKQPEKPLRPVRDDPEKYLNPDPDSPFPDRADTVSAQVNHVAGLLTCFLFGFLPIPNEEQWIKHVRKVL